MLASVTSEMFREQYADVFEGDERWQQSAGADRRSLRVGADSTYIRNPPFFEGITMEPAPLRDITGARVLALLGDSITTDHISPAGSIKKDSPAGKYLIAHGVQPQDFNSYGARRGNHEVMMRGTFANVRLRNQLAPGTEGGWTTLPAGRRGDDDLRRRDEVSATPACRWSSSPARSTGRDRRATGRRRARCCSASRPSSPRASSASIAATSSTWACCRCSSRPAQSRRVARADGPRDVRPRRIRSVRSTPRGTVTRARAP